MRTLFPSIEPFQKHQISVSNIHSIYFEESGNPQGTPIVFLHGGPGGGTEADHRRLYDPQKFRIILVDQRGCGQSTPFAELRENTTWDLIKDLEKIRETLGIKTWLVHGGSWGSTLALVYAIQHPSAIRGLILRGVFLCTQKELKWFYQEGASWIFPEEWDSFEKFIPEKERHDLMAAYTKRLHSADEETVLEAALLWSRWEASTSKLVPSLGFIQKYENPKKALPFARIEAHYFSHGAFLPADNFILKNVGAIKDIPTRIVHGRYDVVCPIRTAWKLHKALHQSELKITPEAGHSLFEPATLSAVIEACEELEMLTR